MGMVRRVDDVSILIRVLKSAFVKQLKKSTGWFGWADVCFSFSVLLLVTCPATRHHILDVSPDPDPET